VRFAREYEQRYPTPLDAPTGAVLASSLDYEQILRRIAELAVPRLADWCSVALPAGDELRTVAVAHADPAREHERRRATLPDAAHGFREGVALVDNGSAGEPRGARAVMIVPMLSGGRAVGVISFVSAESRRTFTAADRELAEELGRRAGVAVENARLYTERSRIAHTLQARLLPSRLPAPPGVRLAARYRAAAANDWAPAHVLRRLNDTLLHEEDTQFVTVALAYLRHEGQDTRVRLVLGGHPPPFVVRADGRVESVGEPGMLLGIRSDVRLQETEATLAPGDSLLLYTDGITEAGPRNAPVGEHGLAAVLERVGSVDPERLVAAVDEAAREADPGRARDDVAIVALQAMNVREAAEPLELRLPAEPTALRQLREAVVEYAARVTGGIDEDAVRLAVGEACSNVVVHAYRQAAGPGDIHVRALMSDDGIVVEIRDDGCGPSPRTDSPGMGLGLPLMARLSRELQVLAREPSGTLVRLTF
jgi:anti-sigma regulatory factor (Ser/Thr protein kinase)